MLSQIELIFLHQFSQTLQLLKTNNQQGAAMNDFNRFRKPVLDKKSLTYMTIGFILGMFLVLIF